MDSNPSQPSTSTLVVAELYKEDQQATGSLTSLGVTNEERAHPQLNSGMSASIYTKPIYSASTIIHSESASEHNVSAKSKAEVDSGLSAPKDSISQTTEKTKSTSEWLETVESVQAKIKTLNALPSLLNRVTEALNKFSQVIESTSTKAGDKGEHIKKDKGKKAMSLKDGNEEGSESDYNDTIHLTGFIVESSKKKKLKKFDFVTEGRILLSTIEDFRDFSNEMISEAKRTHPHSKELQLVNNLLSEMTRYLLQKRSRAEEEMRMRSLSHLTATVCILCVCARKHLGGR
nr:hypothetical protein [Tanacetum cinerariifolium]